jgi:hypothetical protein
MAHGEAEKCFDDIGNLFRAVVVPDQVQDDSPLVLGEIGAAPCTFPSCRSVAMRHRSSVVPRRTPISS